MDIVYEEVSKVGNCDYCTRPNLLGRVYVFENGRGDQSRMCDQCKEDFDKVQNKKQPQLKLYIWKDVLSDYTPGLAVALAYNKREALKLMKKNSITEGGFEEIKNTKPQMTTKPIAVCVHGGS